MDEKIRDPEQIVALFNHNVALEHGAIYQYLQHAYAIGDEGVGAEIISIARSEMRHLKYFAGIITELGGTVTLERPNVTVRAATIEDMMQLGYAAEEEAVRDYTSQLDRIDHAGALRVLERVIADEVFHREQWSGFEAEVRQMAAKASFPSPGPVEDPATANLLNNLFQQEYNHLLIYLRHYFQTADWEAKDFLFENAYWKMKEMSLLADEIHERGADPDFHWGPRPLEGSVVERIAQAIEIEQIDQATYQKGLGCPIPKEVRDLFQNGLTHARYQEGQMKLLRDLIAKPGQGSPGLAQFGGPGPLAHPIPVAGRPPEALGTASPHGEGYDPNQSAQPAPADRPMLTVGSLLDHPLL